jgi:tetratricopeptide (TPR) repeat protein
LRENRDAEGELQVRRDLIARYRSDEDLHRLVAVSLSEAARILRARGDTEEALSAIRELSLLAGENSDGRIARIEVEALINTASHLLRARRFRDALEMLDSVIAKHAADSDPHWRSELARAMSVRVETLTDAGDVGPGLAAVGEYFETFGQGADGELAEYSASVFLRHSLLLDKDGRRSDAQDGLRELIRRYEHSETPEVQQYVAWAIRQLTRWESKQRGSPVTRLLREARARFNAPS